MANLTTLAASTAWAPDQNIFSPTDAVPEALILQHSTIGGVIEGDRPSLRVAFVDDDTAQFTAEGEEIPEADPSLDEVLVHTAKVTQLVRITNEQHNQQGTAAELSTSVQRAIIRKADEAFLTQTAPVTPAVAPPAGIINVGGITAGGEVTTNLDPLIDLIAALEANGGTPTGIILGPTAWASIRKLKTATGHETTLLGAGTTDAQRQLLDLPVIVSNALTPNSGLVIDSNAIASAVGAVKVATDNSVYFTSDGIALRATWRIGWNIVRPNRIGKFTIA